MTTIAVGQGGGPTAVINDTLAGVVHEAQRHGWKIIGLKNGLEGGGLNPEIAGNLCDLSSWTEAEINSIRGIPGAYLGTTRIKLKSSDEEGRKKIDKIRSNMDSLGVDAVIYIGGNDSADVIMAEGKGIHVEKTEDNDLPDNDHTSGWGSACLSNSEIIRRLAPDMSSFKPRVRKEGRDCYSTAPVVVYQTQGRDTGWLTLGCGFAKINRNGDVEEKAAPHIFLPRETHYDERDLLDAVDNWLSRQGWAFIVCSEELVNVEGAKLSKVYSSAGERLDEHGHTEAARSGAFNYAEFIASVVSKKLGVDAEARDYLKVKETPMTPQHIQRCLMRSHVDADEACAAGREAVRALHSGRINVSIGLKRDLQDDGYSIYPTVNRLEDVAGKVRRVDERYLGDINGPSSDFYYDFLPLLGGAEALTHFDAPEFKEYRR